MYNIQTFIQMLTGQMYGQGELYAKNSAQAVKSPVPATTLRLRANELVDQISRDTGEARHVIWQRIYKRLHFLYGVLIGQQPRQRGESLLQVAERIGYLEQTYAITLAEQLYSQYIPE